MLTLKENERLHIMAVLVATNFNQAEACRILEISTRTLRNKLQSWGIGQKEISQMKYESYFKNNIPAQRMGNKKPDDIDFPKYFATNDERLEHANSMINRNFL